MFFSPCQTNRTCEDYIPSKLDIIGTRELHEPIYY